MITGQFSIARFCSDNRVIADRAFFHGLEGICLTYLDQFNFYRYTK